MKEFWFFDFIYCIVWPFFSLFHPIKVIGREHIPAGATIVCGNHTGMADPIYACFAVQRKHQLRPLAKIEIRRVPVLGWLLEKGGVIFVDRGTADIKAVKTVLRWLKGEGKILIFPEGTRTAEGEEGQGKNGAAFFACRAGACILPVYIPRKRKWFRPIEIRIGAPFTPTFEGRKPTSDELDKITEKIMFEISKLKEDAA